MVSKRKTAIVTGGSQATTRPHQAGQASFKAILPEDIDWKPFSAFPARARLAIVVGHPPEPGPYLIRVKVPGGVKLMPAQTPRGSNLHSDFGYFLRRAW
jgi:hypothetical protein